MFNSSFHGCRDAMKIDMSCRNKAQKMFMFGLNNYWLHSRDTPPQRDLSEALKRTNFASVDQELPLGTILRYSSHSTWKNKPKKHSPRGHVQYVLFLYRIYIYKYIYMKYIYIYVTHLYICICICICICIYVYMSKCVNTYIYIYAYKFVYIYIYVYICINVYMYKCVYIYV